MSTDKDRMADALLAEVEGLLDAIEEASESTEEDAEQQLLDVFGEHLKKMNATYEEAVRASKERSTLARWTGAVRS